MANEEPVKTENHPHLSSFRQDHFTGIQHNFELFPTHDYNSTFEQLLDINLQIGDSYEENEVWNQFQEHKAIALQDSRIHHNGETEEEEEEEDGNQHVNFLSFPDNEEEDSVTEATGASQKQEPQEIDDNLHLAPPGSHCWSMSGEHEMPVGKEFPDAKACRKAVRDAAISHRFEIHTIKSDKTRFTAKCMSQGCPWRIHCAKLPNSLTFTVRTVHDTHTCGGVSHPGHQQATVQWVADAVAEKVKANPLFKPKQILEEIHRTHGIALSYKQAWRGKERLIGKNLRGSFEEEEYRLLPQYCHELIRRNPGSVALVHANPIDESFQQVFLSFKASISGFLTSCRPLIALDKAVLKSKYPGTLLLASSFDGDGGVFPLAYSIVNEENDSNWYRFLTELRKVLESTSPKVITILSTMEKAIVDGVESNFPGAFHGLCVHHLAGRLHKEFHSSALVSLLWEAAHAPTVIAFTSIINNIQQISPEAFSWIRNVSPSLWASSYFKGTRFGQLTANVVTDSLIKSWIEDVSGLPIIQTMECINRHLIDMFKERREGSLHWSDNVLVPSAESRMLGAIVKSRGHRVYRANEAEFEVMTSEGNVVVDIKNRSCLCRRWEVYGLPCSHAVGALLSCEEDVYKYAESCFTVESYRRTYGEAIEAVSDNVEWRERVIKREDGGGGDGIRTPKVTGAARRTRRKRIRPEDRDRVKRLVHCTRCKQTGHFRTTCIAPM